jgi:hypothetical protein
VSSPATPHGQAAALHRGAVPAGPVSGPALSRVRVRTMHAARAGRENGQAASREAASKAVEGAPAQEILRAESPADPRLVSGSSLGTSRRSPGVAALPARPAKPPAGPPTDDTPRTIRAATRRPVGLSPGSVGTRTSPAGDSAFPTCDSTCSKPSRIASWEPRNQLPV